MLVFHRIILFVLVTFCASFVHAQDDDFKKMQEEFNNFGKKITEEFKAYGDSIDQAFIDAMEKNWKAFEAMAPITPEDTIDKPVKQPKAEPIRKNQDIPSIQLKPSGLINGNSVGVNSLPTVTPPDPIYSFPIITMEEEPLPDPLPATDPVEDVKVEVEPFPVLDPTPIPDPKPDKPVETVKTDEKPLEEPADEPILPANLNVPGFIFYDEPIELPEKNEFQIDKSSKVSQEVFPAFWKSMVKTDYASALNRLSKQASKLNLNDWGFAELVEDAGKNVFPGDENYTTLFTWFMMLKAGYKVKAGINEKRIVLLIPSPSKMYSTSIFNLDGQKYYVYASEEQKRKVSGSFFTYQGEYNQGNQSVNLFIKKSPEFRVNPKEVKKKWNFEGKEYSLTLKCNPSAMAFYTHYPQTDLPIYFSSEPSSIAVKALDNQMAPMLEGRSQQEKVQFLLTFVQQAIAYKTDDEQFGFEKYFFPEEVLFYPYADCEDRSAFFTWLVKHFTGLPVVGLDYPGHVSAAVSFPESVSGDYFTHEGKKFVICDPTYIGSRIGQAMPLYKKEAFDIIQPVY